MCWLLPAVEGGVVVVPAREVESPGGGPLTGQGGAHDSSTTEERGREGGLSGAGVLSCVLQSGQARPVVLNHVVTKLISALRGEKQEV